MMHEAVQQQTADDGRMCREVGAKNGGASIRLSREDISNVALV
jgi:hypothetical protein